MDDEARSAQPVGDAERQRAVDVLCQAFADDRIGVQEFEHRVGLAHTAETRAELARLLSGVESAAALVARGEPDGPPARQPLAEHPTQAMTAVRPTSFIAGIMGGGTRAGAWHPARTNYAVGFMGGFSLDLRDAPLPPGETEIRIFCMLGGGEIIVPPDVRVEVSATGIMGGFEYNHTVPGTLDPAAPLVRITGLCFMGGAEIAVRYSGESSKDARQRRRLEKKSRRQALKAARERER